MPTVWNDTLPDSRRRALEARLESRRRQLAELERATAAAEGGIARTLVEVQAATVRRVITELEAELASI